MNSVHLRKLSNEKLWSLLKPQFEKNNISLPENKEFVQRALNVFKEKMETLGDATKLFCPIDDKFFKVSEESGAVLKWETSPKVLLAWKNRLERMDSEFMTTEEFKEIQDHIKLQLGVKGGPLFMPVRIAVIGQPRGSDLQSLVPLLSRQSLLMRVEKVISFCQTVS